MSTTRKSKTTSQGGHREHARDRDGAYAHRLRKMRDNGLKPPITVGEEAQDEGTARNVIDCGWGRLLFAQGFNSPAELLDCLREEHDEQRDIAVYVRDPQVLLGQAPGEVFLDPSHTYRLQLSTFRASRHQPKGFFIRRLTSIDDADAINRLYAARGMVKIEPEFFWEQRDARSISYFVAEDKETGEIIGTATAIDHAKAVDDPENGSSLWCLAVDPQARHSGVGRSLVGHLAEYFTTRGRAYMDLSVLHDNEEAIALYEKLGLERVPFFAVKRKNTINEKLFVGPTTDDELNPYAAIIVKEARLRGIHVELSDPERGYFTLIHGARSIRCRESLSEHTSAVALSLCDDKGATRRVAETAGVSVPAQMNADAPAPELERFIAEHGKVVIKPTSGEQGRGVSVGLTSLDEVTGATKEARAVSSQVIMEECIDGTDLRLVVINHQLVAAAVRQPPEVVGNGRDTIRHLIASQSRRRASATGGESCIPFDAETKRTIASQGYSLDDVLPQAETLRVRRTANLHTGGTIHDVSDIVHPKLVEDAIRLTRAIDIPVAGIDFMIKAPDQPHYWFIEANERPGLANHEPHPTAERFIDLLFPLTAARSARPSL
ncbi:N-acetylglutaminylglutamine synthetase [Roseibium polysiphoniae]|uniref:N-acetylglutaminylglutamine synthetase n=1 Tax=Roseibium polysiphoniae TaxID=2571221 RepID=UPI00329A6F19